jgi:membrane protease YdiL (CAAX protease family)
VRGGSENRWEGSTEIGVSPRKTGTGLMPSQIIEAVRGAFWKPTFVDVVSEIPRALFLAVAALLPALASIFIGKQLRDLGYMREGALLISAVILTTTVGILFWLKARQVPGLYGWRAPTGLGWLIVFPAALIGAVPGGAWAPGSLGYRLGPDNLYELTASAALLLPLGAELLFRGVILGHLAARLPVGKSGGPWWGSSPTLISAGLYAAASLVLFLSFSSGQLEISQGFLALAGAVIFGIASGIARERSQSILSSVLLHWACVAVLLLSSRLLS